MAVFWRGNNLSLLQCQLAFMFPTIDWPGYVIVEIYEWDSLRQETGYSAVTAREHLEKSQKRSGVWHCWGSNSSKFTKVKLFKMWYLKWVTYRRSQLSYVMLWCCKFWAVHNFIISSMLHHTFSHIFPYPMKSMLTIG